MSWPITRADFARLGEHAGPAPCDARYVIAPVHPALLACAAGESGRPDDRKRETELMHKTHQVPASPLNLALTAILEAETPLDHLLRFRWRTSVLEVSGK